MTMMIPTELEGEYLVRVVDLPDGSRGFVLYDDDDFANVYVNAHLNDVMQHMASDHEMKHIINDDIHNDDDIRVIEARADKRDKLMKAIPSLKKARDLMPKEEPKRKMIKLTPHQIAVLKRCIQELDSFRANGGEMYGP